MPKKKNRRKEIQAARRAAAAKPAPQRVIRREKFNAAMAAAVLQIDAEKSR